MRPLIVIFLIFVAMVAAGSVARDFYANLFAPINQALESTNAQ